MYYGKKKLGYTKLFGTNCWPTRDRWAEERITKIIDGPPVDFIVAITEWIDENLPLMIKRAINFNKQTKQRIILSTNLDYATEKKHGSIFFNDDKVRIECGFLRSGNESWSVEIQYADPEMFEHIEGALRRFYNG